MSDDFDYVKVGVPDAEEPFSIQELLGSMSDMTPESAAFIGAFYGEPGARKTTRAMEVAQGITPPDKKILYVYTGQGWSSLMNYPHLMKRTKKMPFIRYAQIEQLINVLLNKSMREKMNIGTIIFDEYNRMQDMDTDRLTRHRASLVNSAPKKRRDKEGVEVYKDPDTPEWPEYNTTKIRMINLMNDLLMLNELNVIFVAHTRMQKKTGKVEPDFPYTTASAFISMVHSIYYCKKVDKQVGDKWITEFPIELVGGEQTVSKNRIGGLPSQVMDTKPIVEAYLKWGIVKEDSSVVDAPQDDVLVNAKPAQVITTEDVVETVTTETDSTDDKDSVTKAEEVKVETTPAVEKADDFLESMFS